MIIVVSWMLEMIVSQLYGSLTLFGLVFVSHLKIGQVVGRKHFHPPESLDSNPLLTESLPDCGKYECKEPLLNVKFHPLPWKTAQKRGAVVSSLMPEGILSRRGGHFPEKVSKAHRLESKGIHGNGGQGKGRRDR